MASTTPVLTQPPATGQTLTLATLTPDKEGEDEKEKTTTLKEAVEYLDSVKKFMEARGMNTEYLKASNTKF